MNTNLLVVSNQRETAWLAILHEFLGTSGTLHIVSEAGAIGKISRTHYDLIVIDATTVQEPAKLVSRLREQRRDARIVVLTISPTWQEARDVLRAGAIDYFDSLDREGFTTRINSALQQPASTSSG